MKTKKPRKSTLQERMQSAGDGSFEKEGTKINWSKIKVKK